MNFENKNYYDILGAPRDASDQKIMEIHQRELFDNMRYNDPRLAEAYYVLGNSERRREYDQYLASKENQVDFSQDVIAPTAGEPTAGEPTVGVPTAGEPTAGEPTAGEPTAEEPTTGEPTAGEPTAEEPTAEEPTAEEPTAEEPTAEEPTVEEPTVEEPTAEEKIETIPIFEEEPKEKKESKFFKGVKRFLTPKINKFRNFSIVLGSSMALFSVLTVTGPATAPMLIVGCALSGLGFSLMSGKLIKKLVLKKDKKIKKISKIQTVETRLIEEYEKKLDENILDLLSKPNNNYKLSIAIAKQKNNIELLEKMIELKNNTLPKKGQITKYKLEITSLKAQLKKSKERLKKYEEKFQTYQVEETKSKWGRGLSQLNQEILETQKKLKEEDKKNSYGIKKLEVKQKSLVKKRNKKAIKFKLKRKETEKFKDKVVKITVNTKNFFKNVFTPIDNISKEEESKTI